MKKYERNCPYCGKLIAYKYKHTLMDAIEKNRKCNYCKQIGKLNPFYRKSHTEEHKKYIKELHKTGHYDEARKKMVLKQTGRPMPEITKKKLSRLLKDYYIDNDNPMLGKTHTEETKELIRQKTKIHWEQYKKTDEYKEWESKKDEYELYKMKVKILTESQDIRSLENYSKRNLYHKYELDHIYPTSQGFKNGVPAELISDINNLRIIPRYKNRSKNNKIIDDIIPAHIKHFFENEKKNN